MMTSCKPISQGPKQPDRQRSLRRARVILVCLAVIVPLLLGGLFARQARRLDALSLGGLAVSARVTRVSGGGTHYAYRVDGVAHTWNVKRRDAPYAHGESFQATYLPAEPSFSRPTTEPSRISEEAARVRGFAWKTCAGILLFFGLFAGIAHRDLRRTAGGAGVLPSPEAYRDRLKEMAGVLFLMMLGVTGFHAQDALANSQSLIPVALGLLLSLGIVGGVLYLALRDGPERALERSRRWFKWLMPLLLVIGLLRLIAAVVG